MPENYRDDLREYLLGGLSASERKAIEERYFQSNEFFDHVEAAEEELIDSYLRGELPAGDRARFERLFLDVPELRKRVEEARVLHEALAGTTPMPPGNRTPASRELRLTAPLRVAFACAALVIFLGALWYIQWSKLRSEIGQLHVQLADQRVRLEALASQPGGYIETIASLTSRSLREFSTNGNMVRIEPRTNLIRLRLSIRPDLKYASYRGTLESADAEPGEHPLWMQTQLTASTGIDGRVVEVLLPRALLRPGDYVLSLDGVTPGGFEKLESCSFRVVE